VAAFVNVFAQVAMERTNLDDNAALERALAGLDYPAPRNKLVELAKTNNAPPEVIDRLLQLPEAADFRDEHQLHDSLGVRIPGTHPHGWQ
jgi:hypothetical protein